MKNLVELPKDLLKLNRQLSIAEKVYKNLKGFLCVYKPPDMDLTEVHSKLRHALVKGINELPRRPVEKIVSIDSGENKIFLQENLADTEQAVGKRYIRKDFKVDFLHPLNQYDSGVQVAVVNDDKDLVDKVYNMRLMRVYELKCRLGVYTDDFTPRGRLVDRATYFHVTKSKIDKLMSSIQASYQREMFKNFGLDPQSQEAFELASKGPLRPKSTNTPPQIYSIRCTDFDRPMMKLEIHIINETSTFMRNLVHDIGVKLKCYAICVHVRRTKDGFCDFNSNCLVFNDWNLENLRENCNLITKIAKENIHKYDKTVVIGQTRDEQKAFYPKNLNSEA